MPESNKLKSTVDEQLWAEEALHFYPILLARAIRFTGNRESAEDVVQDAIMTVLSHPPMPIENREHIRAYLLKAIHHRAIDHLRRKSRIPATQPLETEPISPSRDPDPLVAAEMADLVKTALDSLPAKDKELFRLVYVEGLAYDSIAEQLAISRSVVSIRLSRLRSSLAELVDRKHVAVESQPQVSLPLAGPEVRLNGAQPVHPSKSPYRSQAAYRIDLPELLKEHRGEWVAYVDGKRLRFAKTQIELYRYCLEELKLPHDRFIVRRVAPENNPHVDYFVQ